MFNFNKYLCCGLILLALVLNGCVGASNDPIQKISYTQYQHLVGNRTLVIGESQSVKPLSTLAVTDDSDLHLDDVNYRIGDGVFSNTDFPVDSPFNTRLATVSLQNQVYTHGVIIDATVERLKHSLANDISFDVKNSRLVLNGFLRTVSDYASSNQSVSVVAYAQYLGHATLEINSDKTTFDNLTRTAQSILSAESTGPINFALKYGDSYIDGQNVGVLVVLKYKFIFNNVQETNSFRLALESKLGTGERAEAGLSLDAAFRAALDASHSRTTVKIQVSAQQFGGQPMLLLNSLSSADLAACQTGLSNDVSQSSSCNKLIDKLGDYSSSALLQVSPEDPGSYYAFPSANKSLRLYNSLPNPGLKKYFSKIPRYAPIDSTVSSIQNNLGDVLTQVELGNKVITAYLKDYKSIMPPDILNKYIVADNQLKSIIQYLNNSPTHGSVLKACFASNVNDDCPIYYGSLLKMLSTSIGDQQFILRQISTSLRTYSTSTQKDNAYFILTPLGRSSNNPSEMNYVVSLSKGFGSSMITANPLIKVKTTAESNLNFTWSSEMAYSGHQNKFTITSEISQDFGVTERNFKGCLRLNDYFNQAPYYDCSGAIHETFNDGNKQPEDVLGEKFSQLAYTGNSVIEDITQNNDLNYDINYNVLPRPIPKGDYVKSCKNISYSYDGILSADCDRTLWGSHGYEHAELDYEKYCAYSRGYLPVYYDPSMGRLLCWG